MPRFVRTNCLLLPSLNWIVVASILMMGGFAAADESEQMTRAAKRIRSEFDRLDLNRDSRLSPDEFRVRYERRDLADRDLRLFDNDANGSLSKSEFATVVGLVDARFRGTSPDPVNALLQDAVAALDQSYERWDLRPSELVSAHTFVSNFLDSITPLGKRFVTGRVIDQADRNSDGRISREEGRFFLAQQLGIRLHHGPALREPTGRLVRFDRFIEWDSDRNRSLSRQEFGGSRKDRGQAERLFSQLDQDGNGQVTFPEYARPEAPTYFDSIAWFQAADTDLDAELSRQELEAAVSEERRHLVASTLSSFDDDANLKLDLDEYRRSMIGCYNYPWHRRPPDRNRDGRIDYDEFRFDESGLFQLQRWYFFHRLDLNQDRFLSPEEFEFQRSSPLALRAYSPSTGKSRLLYQSAEFPECGGVSVSRDNRMLLFHHAPPAGLGDARIIRVDLETLEVRALCEGLRASWGPEGRRFVCERSGQDGGIWLMDSTGLQGKRLAAGRSPKWSPDGTRIAFLADNGVCIYEFATDAITPMVAREDHPYQDLGADIAWSPDSRRLAVVGNFAASSQLLVIDQDANQNISLAIRHSFDHGLRSDLSWNPRDGIIVGVPGPDTGTHRVLAFDPETNEDPTTVAAVSAEDQCRSAYLVPSGNWYISVTDR